MGLFYNNTAVSQANSVFINNQSANQVFYNNTLVWKKQFQVFPGNTWEHYVNLNDAGSGYNATSRIINGVLELNGGYNGSNAQCALWVDFTPWKTLTINVSAGSCSHFQFRFGASTTWVNIYGHNQVKVWEQTGASYNPVGSHSLDVSDVNGSYYIFIYLYSGSTVAANWVNVNSVVLS